MTASILRPDQMIKSNAHSHLIADEMLTTHSVHAHRNGRHHRDLRPRGRNDDLLFLVFDETDATGSIDDPFRSRVGGWAYRTRGRFLGRHCWGRRCEGVGTAATSVHGHDANINFRGGVGSVWPDRRDYDDQWSATGRSLWKLSKETCEE